MNAMKCTEAGSDPGPPAPQSKPTHTARPNGADNEISVEHRVVGEGTDTADAAGARELSRYLAETYDTANVLQQMQIDAAAASYYLEQKLRRWSATTARIIDEAVFQQPLDDPRDQL